ncbi:large protein with possible domain of nucleoporin [Cryptosporidium felis]|nr:large protein with possible domain of nucleoporin [Cryptosporidium felis]
MQKTVCEEVKNRKGAKSLEVWLSKNLSISVFQFSENSKYLKNWLEYFHLGSFQTCENASNFDLRRVERGSFDDRSHSGARKEPGAAASAVQSVNKILFGPLGTELLSDRAKETQTNLGEGSFKSDQGYLLYNAKQYLSAGQYYYSKSKIPWRTPSTFGSMALKTPIRGFGDILEGDQKLSEGPIGCDEAEVRTLHEFLLKDLENYKRRVSSLSFIQGGRRLEGIFELFSDIYLQVLNMQQSPTLLQRKSFLLQSQTCIERDMDEVKNKEFIKNIRSDIYNVDAQLEMLVQIAEFINYYILSALDQNVNIGPLVRQLFQLFRAAPFLVGGTQVNLNFSEKALSIPGGEDLPLLGQIDGISQEGVEIFRSLILGLFHIQSMVHTKESFLEFILEFYNLTGFSSITEIKWLIEHSRNDPRIFAHLLSKIPSLCDFRTKQAFYFETPILFEEDIAELLHLCENSMSNNFGRSSLLTSLSSTVSKQFDSIIEALVLELHRFSVLYYQKFRQNDLVDIYSFDNVTQVVSRVLWWAWPIKFLLFHLNNKSLISRLIPLFSGNSNNSSTLSNMISNNERQEILEMIKASIV